LARSNPRSILASSLLEANLDVSHSSPNSREIEATVLNAVAQDLTAPAAAPAALQPAETHAPPSLNLESVRSDREVQALILQANKNLGVLGFTEHGFRHVGLVSNIARNVMRLLDFDSRLQELAAIAGYLHDIGNIISRHGHASTGALLAYPIVTRLGMSPEDAAIVIGAIGSHGDDNGRLGEPVHAPGAALILADKSDVHRSRVRNPDPAAFDVHDRVNYAATSSFLRVAAEAKTITLELTIDTTIAPVMTYFEIFLPRMLMSRRAAEHLGCAFHITVNEVVLL
jgi:metal-dependent HD superfamily phosphatase/phosphodiesterase